jgi:hypothetical protein
VQKCQTTISTRDRWLLIILLLVTSSSCDDGTGPPGFLGYSTRHVVAGRVFLQNGVVAPNVEVRARAFRVPDPPASPPPECTDAGWASASATSSSDGTFTVLLTAPRFETMTCIRVEALQSGNVVATSIVPTARFRVQTSAPDTSFVALTISN